MVLIVVFILVLYISRFHDLTRVEPNKRVRVELRRRNQLFTKHDKMRVMATMCLDTVTPVQLSIVTVRSRLDLMCQNVIFFLYFTIMAVLRVILT